MIFIGAELSDPHAHFVTNIVACIGTGNDLIIDLLKVKESAAIFDRIAAHLKIHDERYVIYNAYTDEDFFIGLKERFPTLRLITVFSDDEWRHANYDRYLALYSDISSITDIGNFGRYDEYGINALYMPWACNPNEFYPLSEPKKYNVSFIGAAYGVRINYLRFLISEGIHVSIFGRGWDRVPGMKKYWGGFLTHEDMLRVISQSKVNLNFLWTSASSELSVIKGRLMELAACRSFQLVSPANALEKNGFIGGDNIAIFCDQQELLAKVKYYLAHEKEREAIAARAYEHVLRNHTWKQRFQELFHYLEKNPAMAARISKKYRILVLAQAGVRHQISPDDERMDIRIVEPKSSWHEGLVDVDGVVRLTRDSSFNNETLYMMVFGLAADKSDVVVANFYAGDSGNRYWIRVVDRMVEQKRRLLRMLPATCMMFSGKYAAEHGCELASDLSQLKVSYIEYPSFWLKLPYHLARKLRLYFAYHGDSRKKFKRCLRSLQLGKAMSLGLDKIWQHTI